MIWVLLVGEAGDGAEALDLAARTRPHVALMDIRMLFEALRAGASGFLLKTAPADQLLSAVHLAAQGEALLSPSVTRRLIEDYARRPAPERLGRALDELTPRELDVLRLVARGQSNREIADELVIAPATVKSHVASLLGKLGLRDRVQLVVTAYESGLVQAGAERT